MEKIISIVIPAYNISNYIDRVMTSLLNISDLQKLEIIVVNDGSKDDTHAKAMHYVNSYSSIVRLIDKENGGHGSTINSGIAYATGKYFKVIDGDDWCDSTELQSFIEKLADINDDMVVSNYTLTDSDGTFVKQQEVIPTGLMYNVTYKFNDICRNCEIFKFHSLFFKTSIFKKSKKIREKCFYVDMEYAVFPIEYVETIRFLGENIYQYQLGRDGQSVSKENYVKNRENIVNVILDLCDFYREADLSNNKKLYVIKLIDMLYSKVLQIYFWLNNKCTANEYIIPLEETIKNNYYNIYSVLNGKMLLKILRLTKYNIYIPLLLLRQIIKHEEW